MQKSSVLNFSLLLFVTILGIGFVVGKLSSLVVLATGKDNTNATSGNGKKDDDQNDPEEVSHELSTLDLVAIGINGVLELSFPLIVGHAGLTIEFLTRGDAASPGESPEEAEDEPSDAAAARDVVQ